jgi:hypothetical protein
MRGTGRDAAAIAAIARSPVIAFRRCGGIAAELPLLPPCARRFWRPAADRAPDRGAVPGLLREPRAAAALVSGRPAPPRQMRAAAHAGLLVSCAIAIAVPWL